MTDIVERFESAVRANGYRIMGDLSELEYHSAKNELSALLSSLRSRAEKAEAERQQSSREWRKAFDAMHQRAMAAEATCEKLAAALEESRAAHLLLIAPQYIVGSSVIEALTKVTAAELSARTALAAYRKEASNAC